MNNKSIYTSVIISKTGIEIPVCADGRTVESKYNPEREAENLISSKLSNEELVKNHNNSSSYFFIVTGISSGTLIEKLADFFPESKILAVESSSENITFLNSLGTIKKLKTNSNVILTDIDNIEKNLIDNYLPAIYSELKIIEQRGWIDQNREFIEILNKKINRSIGIISADFSVQAHFGKIWQSNIINNLKTLSFAENKIFKKINKEKKAAIIAAGPSLDKSVKTLIKNRNDYFIIATDTAFSVLIKYNIVPEVVISIDGQHVSHNHFNNVKICKNTLFLLDLCSDYSVGKFLQSNKNEVAYFISGHPLSSLANTISNKKFPKFFSGAGTVTITALDFALKAGFSHIEVFGADFSYVKGKSYAKGTYFDNIFGLSASKINSTEKQYSKLMYRTKLLKISDKEYSTDILSAYKMSFEKYLTDNKYMFRKKDYVYMIESLDPENNKNRFFNLESFNYNFNNFINIIKNAELNELKYPLMPYVAWLKNKKNTNGLEFIALLKLAQSNIVRYN